MVLILFVFSEIATAQSEENVEPPKNVVYFKAGTSFIYNSITLNYDLLLRNRERGVFKNYYLNFEAGTYHRNSGFAPGPGYNGLLGSIGVVGLTGKKNSHFEVGLGASFNRDTRIINQDGSDNRKYSFILPKLTLGYRYQKKNGVVFRVGTSIPELIYMSWGYGF